jgi:hypothetical protein
VHILFRLAGEKVYPTCSVRGVLLIGRDGRMVWNNVRIDISPMRDDSGLRDEMVGGLLGGLA